MDIVEFCEKICGVELAEWQKEYLRTYKKLSESGSLLDKLGRTDHIGLRTIITAIDEYDPETSPDVNTVFMLQNETRQEKEK